MNPNILHNKESERKEEKEKIVEIPEWGQIERRNEINVC
jgi:hypothetical protein